MLEDRVAIGKLVSQLEKKRPEHGGRIPFRLIVEGEIETCDSDMRLSSLLAIGIFNGSRAEDSLAASCKAVEPEKCAGLSDPPGEMWPLNEPHSGAWMAFCACGIVVD
jgi:hypothetical protein